MIGIYKITNLKNGKVYIGQSTDVEKRWDKYYSKLNCKNQPKIYRSLNKHGVENHIFELIHECEVKDLNRLERYYQELYNSVEKGLNCVLQESEETPRILSEETRRRISEGNKGKKLSNETKDKIGKAHKGRIVSKETREKLRKVNLGRKHTEEARLKMSEVRKGKTSPNKGKKLSEETKRKISEANKGRKRTEEVRLKMSEVRKGRVQSEETRRKISEGRKGKQIKEIKAISLEGKVYINGITDLSKELNTSRGTIKKILNGGYSKKWKDWTFEYVEKK